MYRRLSSLRLSANTNLSKARRLDSLRYTLLHRVNPGSAEANPYTDRRNVGMKQCITTEGKINLLFEEEPLFWERRHPACLFDSQGYRLVP